MVPTIAETLSKVQQKLASAQAKMSFNFGSKQGASHKPVSNFDTIPEMVDSSVQQYNKHNSDLLLATAEHSDIKNTQKHLMFNSNSTFNSNNTDSTALMTASNNRSSIISAKGQSQYGSAS